MIEKDAGRKMRMRYLGRTIEFDSQYRPEEIFVDGERFSMENTVKAHGYSWTSGADGNYLIYTADDLKRGFSIPQFKFQIVKNKNTISC